MYVHEVTHFPFYLCDKTDIKGNHLLKPSLSLYPSPTETHQYPCVLAYIDPGSVCFPKLYGIVCGLAGGFDSSPH